MSATEVIFTVRTDVRCVCEPLLKLLFTNYRQNNSLSKEISILYKISEPLHNLLPAQIVSDYVLRTFDCFNFKFVVLQKQKPPPYSTALSFRLVYE